MKTLIGALVLGTVLLATPAFAHHDKIYTPCDTETGHIHMSYEEVVARISIMEQDGTIPPGMVSRYVEARDGGKGNEDPRFVWARNLEEGQILSLGNWASGDHPEVEALMFSSGLVAEWQLDANKQVRRFNDPYWMQPNPLSPSFTVWESLCMANLGYSIPIFEIDDDGDWVSNIPTTTTTILSDPIGSVNQQITVTENVSSLTQGTTPKVLTEETHSPPPHSLPITKVRSVGDYDLFDAEWDGYPFEATVRLLEDRYPPNTPGKYYFRLSYAVEFLREGGMIRGLDNLWNSNE